jgi:YfiR/HmsC-like
MFLRLTPALCVRKALALLALSCVCTNAWGSDALIRWGFVTNFARYTEWPTQKWANGSAPLSVCLLAGDKDMNAEISSLEKHTVGGRPLRGVQITRLPELDACAVVYVPTDYKPPLKPIFDAADKHKILTISDRVDFIEEGGMIGLTPSGGRYVFDVNLITTRAAELKLSSQLLKLARTVK